MWTLAASLFIDTVRLHLISYLRPFLLIRQVLLASPPFDFGWLTQALCCSGISAMTQTETDRTKVFISYSHKDVWALEQFHIHLKPLEREGIVERWDDTRIKTGQRWKEEIRKALASAKVAVLLISPDFLASDFIATDELPPLLAAAEKEGLVVMPVILRPSRFSRIESLSQFQAVNPLDKPLKTLNEVEQDIFWVKLTEDIENVIHPQ